MDPQQVAPFRLAAVRDELSPDNLSPQNEDGWTLLHLELSSGRVGLARMLQGVLSRYLQKAMSQPTRALAAPSITTQSPSPHPRLRFTTFPHQCPMPPLLAPSLG